MERDLLSVRDLPAHHAGAGLLHLGPGHLPVPPQGYALRRHGKVERTRLQVRAGLQRIIARFASFCCPRLYWLVASQISRTAGSIGSALSCALRRSTSNLSSCALLAA